MHLSKIYSLGRWHTLGVEFKIYYLNMRQHLLQCFTNGEFKPFPSKKRRKRAAKLTQRIQLYCTCETTNKSDTMIKCCSCENVFHKKCINLADDASFYKCNRS